MPRNLARHVERGADGRSVSDDGVSAAHRAQLILELLDLRAQLLTLGRLSHGEHHFLRAEGLLHVVVGALLHRRDRRVGVAVSAHRDHERVPTSGRVALDELEAVHLRHAQIAEHEIDIFVGELAEGFFALASSADSVSFRAENPGNRLAESRLVIDDENLHEWGEEVPAGRSSETADSSGTGKYIMNAAPPSRAWRTQIVPPSPSTMRDTTASPSPVPRPGSFVV